MQRGQAERLIPVLIELLTEADAEMPDLTRIGVGTGPGNFTGIRISVSAARGLALALGVPAMGVSTLRAAAFGRNLPVVAAAAAPRGMFYAQRFDPAGHPPVDPVLLDATELAEITQSTPIASYDAQALSRVGLDHRHRTPTYPLADAIALIAARAPADTPPPAPLYVKPADAAPPRDAPPVMLS